MKIKKYRINFIILLLIAAASSFAQDSFKEVKTADDVLDNNILASGGRDKLKKIKSELTTGTLKLHGFGGDFVFFRGDTLSMRSVNGKVEEVDMLIMKAVVTKNYAWQYQMGETQDYEGAELQKKADDLLTDRPLFYLNYKKNGFASEYKGIDTVDGNANYVVVFSKSGKEVRTNYYDVKTFYLNKTVKPGSMAEIIFDDYRETGGVKKPFKVHQTGESDIEFEITGYKFNEPLDSKMILKPVGK